MVNSSQFSRRIDITIEPHLLKAIDLAAQHHLTSRSAIIRSALSDWLARQQPVAHKPTEQVRFAERPSFHTLIKPGMTPDALLDLLQDYEAGKYNIK